MPSETTEAPVRRAPSTTVLDRTVEISDRSMPWANWPEQRAVSASVKDIVFRVNGDSLRPVMAVAGTDFVAEPSLNALRELSTRVGFPVDFVSKLPTNVQVDVLNARVADTDDTRFSLVSEQKFKSQNGVLVPDEGGGYTVTNIAPSWRGIPASVDVVETVWAMMRDVFGPELQLVSASRGDDGVRMKVKTPFSVPVTPNGRSVGDVLSLGLGLHYQPGMKLTAWLYAERLRCLNGMIGQDVLFDWSGKQTGRVEDQLGWLTIAVADVIGHFDTMAGRAAEMASTPVDGDPLVALIERARAMRIPKRFDERLLLAYAEEPGSTEWDMLNAFSRLGTHGGLPVAASEAVQRASGLWTSGFDVVTARLPRPLALAAGAHILNEDGD